MYAHLSGFLKSLPLSPRDLLSAWNLPASGVRQPTTSTRFQRRSVLLFVRHSGAELDHGCDVCWLGSQNNNVPLMHGSLMGALLIDLMQSFVYPTHSAHFWMACRSSATLFGQEFRGLIREQINPDCCKVLIQGKKSLCHENIRHWMQICMPVVWVLASLYMSILVLVRWHCFFT